MEVEMKDKVNVWDVIDTYFRDEPYYKSQHQVDSFNEFILSKENGIQNIIKRSSNNLTHIFSTIKIFVFALNADDCISKRSVPYSKS